MENYFLWALGFWNLIGSIALYLMLNEAIADRILRTWTETITHPYDAGKYGSLWLFWAATTNTFFGFVNLVATQWELASKIAIIYGDLFAYGVFLLPLLVVLRNENYGRGLYITMLLGIFWIGWAIYCLLRL